MKNRVPRPLSHGDIQFIKLLFDGEPRAAAFREAYPDNRAVQRWHKAQALPKDSRERRNAKDNLQSAAKWKVNSKHWRWDPQLAMWQNILTGEIREAQ